MSEAFAPRGQALHRRRGSRRGGACGNVAGALHRSSPAGSLRLAYLLILAATTGFCCCAQGRLPSDDSARGGRGRDPASPHQIPPRPEGAPSGSDFIARVASLSREEREAAILRELLSGNVPPSLRELRRVEVQATGGDGVHRIVAFEVMPDYLAIGSDDDFVRMPMNPHTAQAFCDSFGFALPTRKMVDDIWAAAEARVEPMPLTEERESPVTFLEHHRIIERQLADAERGVLVAGIKKDVVVTNRLLERAERVAIFGWHHLGGDPIQPLYVGHVDWYVDYSHGIRPVRTTVWVDGVPRSYGEVLNDEQLAPLLSDEGVIHRPRYEG